MAARNEEQRKAEIKRRRQYRVVDAGQDNKEQWTNNLRPRPRPGISQSSRGVSKPPQPQSTYQASSAQEGVGPCFQCGNPGHLARNCRMCKSESQGRSNSSFRKQTPTTKQVTTSVAGKEATLDPEDPRAYLPLDSDEGDVKLIQVQDKGSQPQCAQVQIGGVPVWGIVDSGADISKRLFLAIAAASKLKKRDCKKPDKIPKTYDRKPFSLHGMLELEVV